MTQLETGLLGKSMNHGGSNLVRLVHGSQSMQERFDAAVFLARFDEGEFDGRLDQELRRLTDDQLQQLHSLLAGHFPFSAPDEPLSP